MFIRVFDATSVIQRAIFIKSTKLFILLPAPSKVYCLLLNALLENNSNAWKSIKIMDPRQLTPAN